MQQADASHSRQLAVPEFLRELEKRAENDIRARRLLHDATELVELAAGNWLGRFFLLGATPPFAGPDRQTVLVCGLHTPGWVREDDLTREHGAFRFLIGVPFFFPLVKPSIFFVPPVPWSPHVIHDGGFPDRDSLPAELRLHLEQGQGSTCWIRNEQWCADARSMPLSMVVYQVSRILGGTAYCEAAALNPAARDELLRNGPPDNSRPLPHPLVLAATDGTPATGDESETADVTWDAE